MSRNSASGTVVFRLTDLEDTLLAGRLLAESLPECGPYPAVLLLGDMGAGKTSLVRGLVSALPGREQAEVSSPSFNIVNYYPTTPEIAHFDLYRLEHQPPEEELLESLEQENRLTVVEWVQYLHEQHWPPRRLELRLSRGDAGRDVGLAWEDPSGCAARFHQAMRLHFEKS
ncbi:MAG: tRNA (adenosine(37)-N6)-threonylcarbamoyltransferase complex ATPase subunit type 1 TsaE [Desulfovibrionaceae bacterium]